MESQLKQRLVGIAVIVSLAVIFLPMLLDGAGMVEKIHYEEDVFEVPPPPKVEHRNVDLEAKEKQVNERLNKIPVLSHDIVDDVNKKQVNVEKPKIINKPKLVKKAVKKAEKIGGDSWIAQLGSFKDQEKAFKLQKKVRAYKIDAVFIQKVIIKGVRSYRVRMGPFLDQKKANEAIGKLHKKHKMKAVIMKHEQ